MADTRLRRGQAAKSAGRRQEIVSAALQVFSEAGYHKGSIRDVAQRVGISQAGVLHHYPSKHRLLEAVLDWRDQDALPAWVPSGRRVSTCSKPSSTWPSTTRRRPSSSSCT